MVKDSKISFATSNMIQNPVCDIKLGQRSHVRHQMHSNIQRSYLKNQIYRQPPFATSSLAQNLEIQFGTSNFIQSHRISLWTWNLVQYPIWNIKYDRKSENSVCGMKFGIQSNLRDEIFYNIPKSYLQYQIWSNPSVAISNFIKNLICGIKSTPKT